MLRVVDRPLLGSVGRLVLRSVDRLMLRFVDRSLLGSVDRLVLRSVDRLMLRFVDRPLLRPASGATTAASARQREQQQENYEYCPHICAKGSYALSSQVK